MPERRILDLPGHTHFLTFSTYQRRRFLDSAETRDIVLEVLQKCLVAHRASCAGFVIMPDHVHALIYGDEDFKITPFVQVWKKTSSFRIRKFFERDLVRYEQLCPEECPIWQARFYDHNVDTQDLMNIKLGYMHENPVVAGFCESSLD
jgi:putative transposase